MAHRFQLDVVVVEGRDFLVVSRTEIAVGRIGIGTVGEFVTLF